MKKKETKLGRIHIAGRNPYLRMIRTSTDTFQLRFGFRLQKYSYCREMEERLKNLVKEGDWNWNTYYFNRYDIYILTYWKKVKSLEEVESAIEELKSEANVELYGDYQKKVLSMLLEALG